MSQTLKFGNGTWATKKGSTLAYNDEDGNFKPLPFTYTGAGKGTRVNKEGLIEVVENDRPRIDYLDSEKGALLLEPSRTNLYAYSEDFSNAAWTKSAATVALTSNISPDGTTNSVYNLTGTNANLYTGGTTGIEHTISIYAKSNGQGKDNFKLRLGNSLSSLITVTDEWVRYEFTATPTTNVFGLTVDSSPNNQWDILIWGAQLEQGSYATSYIPTQGSAQTRVQETASGSGNSEVFNDSQGVLFANIAANADDLTQRVISINDGGSSDYIHIRYHTLSNYIRFIVRSGSVTSFDYAIQVANILLPNKIVVKYDSSTVYLWVNGFEQFTYSPIVPPLGLSELSFDDSLGNNPFYGKTKEIAYYDEILTDLELETLTSYRTWEAMVKELNLNIIHNE